MDWAPATEIGEIIDRYIDAQINAGVERFNPDWLTTAICRDHSEVEGRHARLALGAFREFVRNEVRRRLRRFRAHPSVRADDQLVIPGFERLQQYYAVAADENAEIVRIDLLSDGQLIAKAVEYELMGEGCFAHARELRDYVRERRRCA